MTSAEQPIPRRAWIVLLAAMLGQLPISMLLFGLPALSPTLHDDLGIGIGRFGIVLGALNLGFTLTVLPWGMAADRWGERRVATVGLTASIGAILLLAQADSFLSLTLLAALAGTVSSCSHPAGSIAVMRSFPPHRRSLAYAIRHTATPIGGLVAATALPALAELHHRPFGATPHGLALGSVAIVAVIAAIAVALILPGREVVTGSVNVVQRSETKSQNLALAAALPASAAPVAVVPATAARATAARAVAARPSVRQPADVVRIAVGSASLGTVQLVSTGFLVLYLHDERGMSAVHAAAVLAVVQGLAIIVRPLEGILADRIGSRIAPLRSTAIALVALLPLVALMTGIASEGNAATVAIVGLLGLLGVVASGWNGVAVAAVAERARAGEVGGATALLTAMLAATNTVSPILFALVVGATGWPTAFAVLAVLPVGGALLLRPVRIAGPGPRALQRRRDRDTELETEPLS